jgi:hypothetical protein
MKRTGGHRKLLPGSTARLDWVLMQFFEEKQTESISISYYSESTASHTCRLMAPGLVISDVSNCPVLRQNLIQTQNASH